MVGVWHLGWQIVARDYRVRFRRTFLWAVWFLLPLITLVGIALAVGQNLGLYASGEQGHFLVRLLVGLVCWQLFADAWLEPMRFGRRASAVLRTVVFDQRALLTAGVISGLIGLAIKLPVVVAALVWFDVMPDSNLIFLPLGLAALLGAGVALASLTLPTSLVVMDIRYAMPFVQYALLLTAPIFYEMPDGGPLAAISQINPFTYLVPPVRDSIIGAGANPTFIFIAFGVVALLLVPALVYFEAKVRLAIAYIGR